MTRLRPCLPTDLEGLYDICLKTGDQGSDASALYQDPRLIGAIYAAPYALIEGGLTLVAVKAGQIVGYAAGTLDTRSWEENLERGWWPNLRTRYPAPEGDPTPDWTWDQRRAYQVHNPGRTPVDVLEGYPSHVHMNLRAEVQNRGVGSKLLEAWLEAARQRGATACHVGVNRSNLNGSRFWRARGFQDIVRSPPRHGRTLWLGRDLASAASAGEEQAATPK